MTGAGPGNDQHGVGPVSEQGGAGQHPAPPGQYWSNRGAGGNNVQSGHLRQHQVAPRASATGGAGGHGTAQQYSRPPPGWGGGPPGYHSQQYPVPQGVTGVAVNHPEHQGRVFASEGFQGLTVQQLLEAHVKTFEQELAKQREKVRQFQQQLRLQLLPYHAVEGPGWGPKLSY